MAVNFDSQQVSFHIPKHNLTLTSLQVNNNFSSSTSVKVTYNGTTTTYTLNQSNTRINLNNITLNANSRFEITSTTHPVRINIQITCPNVSGHIIYNSDMSALNEYFITTKRTSPIAGHLSQGQGKPIVGRNIHSDTAGTTISRSFYEYYWNL